MKLTFTPVAQHVLTRMSATTGLSPAAVNALLQAVIRGNGTMAQFSHPDVGGSGQWMRGGMTMVGDMFNSRLQADVAGVCSELSELLANGAITVLDAGPTAHRWWPAEWGDPATSGAQNEDGYAFFPAVRRLALREGGQVRLYDTGDLMISGVSQQQGAVRNWLFASQRGPVDVSRLPPVDAAAGPTQDPSPPVPTPPAAAAPTPPSVGPSTVESVVAAIQALAGLRDEGLLTEDEFTAKKAELLSRV